MSKRKRSDPDFRVKPARPVDHKALASKAEEHVDSVVEFLKRWRAIVDGSRQGAEGWERTFELECHSAFSALASIRYKLQSIQGNEPPF